jgi:hypothetical protein
MAQQRELTFAMFNLASEPSKRKWIALPSHRAWLLREAEALFSFFERRIINPLGGFYDLDDEGDQQRPSWLSRQASPVSLRNLENHSRLRDCLSHGSAGRGHHC